MIESPSRQIKDILPPAQKGFGPELRAACEMGFVLYDGTAIALHLGHHASVDFDPFTEKSLKREEPSRFLVGPQFCRMKKILFLLSSLLRKEAARWLRFPFFGGIRFGCVGIPESTGDGALRDSRKSISDKGVGLHPALVFAYELAASAVKSGSNERLSSQ